MNQMNEVKMNLLLQNDLGCSFRVQPIAPVGQIYHCAHRFAVRVEGVNSNESFFWNLVADSLILLAKAFDEAEKRALGLVTDLHGQVCWVLSRL